MAGEPAHETLLNAQAQRAGPGGMRGLRRNCMSLAPRSCHVGRIAAFCAPMPKTAVTRYRKDPLYARIARATDEILRRGRVVTPVDVLIAMNLLTREHLEDWRRGRIPYLERVIDCNLSRLARLLRILRRRAEEICLKPSFTAYMRWGPGPKARLRFTKTGDPRLEEAYATHFVGRGSEPSQRVVSEERGLAP